MQQHFLLFKKRMDTIQDVFKFILDHYQTIVFGNLGRYPNILYDMLKTIPQLEISVISTYYPFPTDDHRIRTYNPNEQCDLLIYLEPPAFKPIEPHPKARRIAIFTSHLTFKLQNSGSYISYFHGPSPDKSLFELQDFPKQARNANMIKVEDNRHVVILKGHSCNKPVESNTYFIIDLTEHTKDVLAMYLQCLDSFDFLIHHLSSIDKFVICFPEPNGLQWYSNFEQKSFDRLFCETFEDGSSIQSILQSLPYYRSGTIDKKFDVKPTYFGKLPIVIPKSIQEACQAASVYNLKPIVKNVFQINE